MIKTIELCVARLLRFGSLSVRWDSLINKDCVKRKDYIKRIYKQDKEIAKAYLNQLQCIDLRIKSKQIQLDALKNLLYKITTNTDTIRVDGGETVGFADKVNRIMDVTQSIEHDIVMFLDFREDVLYKINKLDRILAIILEYKYVLGRYNWQIAQELRCSPKNIDFLHAEALVKFRKAWLQ